jgi:predicted amidohydrolase YtcJ
LRTDAGGAFVQVGAIKSFTDGSIGGRTARVSDPYADVEETTASADGETEGQREDASADEVASAGEDASAGENGSSATGQWVVDPEELDGLVDRVDGNGLQLTIHAIGDEAIGETVDALAECDDPESSRHRIEHVELATDDQLERMAADGIVASCQPNFLRWAEEGGLYHRRLGDDRRRSSNRFRTMLDAGVRLAFGSDSMPVGPLGGVHHAVNAPTAAQRLTVTEALRAYTRGGAIAGFDEDRLGTLEVGSCADLVVLEESPWEKPDGIRDIDVGMTVVDGTVVYER